MNRFGKITLLLCGLLSMLAAFPVFGQEKESTEIVINKRPLRDLGQKVSDAINGKKVDLSAPFSIQLRFTLTAEGKLDATKTKIIRSEGDRQMIDLARDGVMAFSDSGYLQYLKSVGGKDIDLFVSQDDSAFKTVVGFEVESVNRARSIAALLMVATKYYQDKKSAPGADEDDKDDLAIINNLTIEADGKKVAIKHAMPKADFLNLVQKSILKAKPGPVPNGMAKNIVSL